MRRALLGLVCMASLHSPAQAVDDLPSSSSIIECAVFWHVVADAAGRRGLPFGHRPSTVSRMMLDAGFGFAKARGESVEALNASLLLMQQRMGPAAHNADSLIALALQHKERCDAIEVALAQFLREANRN